MSCNANQHFHYCTPPKAKDHQKEIFGGLFIFCLDIGGETGINTLSY